jgi:hypothetical protein
MTAADEKLPNLPDLGPDLPRGVLDDADWAAAMPSDFVVTIGRRDLGWDATAAGCPAGYSVTVSRVGDMRLFYAPDLARVDLWPYRWTPDHTERHEALMGVWMAGALCAMTEQRPFTALADVPLWVKVHANGFDLWIDLDGCGGPDALAAVGAVEALIPVQVWEMLARRRTRWQAERDRATWRRAQREVAGLVLGVNESQHLPSLDPDLAPAPAPDLGQYAPGDSARNRPESRSGSWLGGGW